MIVEFDRSSIEDMSWAMYRDLCDAFGAGHWDCNRDVVVWIVPESQWSWMLIKHPELQGKRNENTKNKK